ncbi:MBL fold metallo-hydrolase [Pseudophaeobacter flagellatus]|uniref:MBL fold metallo-hydrolase n=1 Tax=Pseudophaeobacter flagellatus TaxID=2899119 RepID=UPI001E5F6F89|nr:MBL fold metallo-hydrolase [Pseudophaeobacter flagellatus]
MGKDMTVNRRDVMTGLAAGLATGLLLPGQGWATAGAAGLTIGDMQLQTLSDGHLVLPRAMLFAGLEPAAVDQILQAKGIGAGPIEPPINVTLLRHGNRVVLFDTGAGPSFQASAGRLLSVLETAGLSPEEVTHVVFTHCHPDHLWGVLDDFDDPLFSNADYLMGRVEWDYWFDPNTASTISNERASMAVGARRRMQIVAERTTRFEDGQEILPGIEAQASYGHTPGHMCFALRSSGESLLIGGDAIGNHHVSFAEPDWPIGTDQDAAQAAKSRLRLLDMLVHDQMRLIGTHLPQGGIGRVEQLGGGFQFIPDSVN